MDINSITAEKLITEERARIIEAINAIDINTTSQINALGMKILIKEIIGLNPVKKLPE